MSKKLSRMKSKVRWKRKLKQEAVWLRDLRRHLPGHEPDRWVT